MAQNRQPHDDLVGLHFEMGGHLGAMRGQILGMAKQLYLVRREGADHLELMELDDLRSAKFFESAGARSMASSGVAGSVGAGAAGGDGGLVARVADAAALSHAPDGQTAASPVTGSTASSEDAAAAPQLAGGKRRLSDQIKRAVSLRPAPPAGD
ncbi:MAG: hypothetical protein AAFO79_10530 [Pseudomonadota bacterium]